MTHLCKKNTQNWHQLCHTWRKQDQKLFLWPSKEYIDEIWLASKKVWPPRAIYWFGSYRSDFKQDKNYSLIDDVLLSFSLHYSVCRLIGSLWAKHKSDNDNQMIQLTDTFCVLFRYNGTSSIVLRYAADSIYCDTIKQRALYFFLSKLI